jgi:quercetin dioxygenase-like cupin family protein
MSLKLKPKLVRAYEGHQQIVLGDEETIKLRGSDTNGQFLLIEQNSIPGIGIPMHVHENEDEVFTVLKGNLKIKLELDEYVLGPGDTMFCPKGIPHAWEVVGTERAQVLLSNFPSGLEFMLEELANLGQAPDFSSVSEISKRYGIEFVKDTVKIA